MKAIQTNRSQFAAKMGVLAVLTLGLIPVVCHAQSIIVPYSFTTVAGSLEIDGVGGYADGTNGSAQFNYPEGIAVDRDLNLYVADRYNHVIRKITPQPNQVWVVSTLAGQPGVAGYGDSPTGSAALFDSPRGVAVDNSGNVYVADTGNNVIREVTPGGAVTTLAGDPFLMSFGSFIGGYQNGPGLTAAEFDFPTGVTVDKAGNLYVADYNNNVIRKMTPPTSANGQWNVTTLAGQPNTFWGNDAATNNEFAYPWGVAVDSAGNVYAADTDNNEIMKITPTGTVTTLAGSAPGPEEILNEFSGIPFPNTDGRGSHARFFLPYGVAVDSAGNVYVADSYNSEIRKITPDGNVTTLGGQPAFNPYSAPCAPLQGTYANGSGSTARFCDPVGVAVDADGNVYVGDTDNCVVRKGVAPQVQVVALEVTQVVQDWNNSVPLTQGKDTYLRAHLQLASSTISSVTVSGALLNGTTANGTPLPNSPITPINPGAALAVTTINASNTIVRRDFTKSLNFRLPPEWLNGTNNLQLIWPGGLLPINVVPNDCSVNVTFSPASVPQIEFWDVQWNGTNQMGDAIHDLRNRVLSCLPVSNLNVTYGILPLAGTQTPDFGKGEQFVDMVNSKLYDQRKRDYAHNLITKRIYHGAIAAYTGLAEETISPNIAGKAMLPLPSFVSCATVVNNWGPGRQSVTHELGHNLGLNHDVDSTIFGTTTIATALGGSLQVALGACTEKGPQDYTYSLFQNVDGYNPPQRPTLGPMFLPDGSGDNSLIYGLDTFALKTTDDSPVLSPVELTFGDLNCYYDLMSYCRNGGLEDLWPSSATYASLAKQNNYIFGPPSSGTAASVKPLRAFHSRSLQPEGGPVDGQEYLVVRGLVNFVTGTAQFRPCLPLTTTNTPPSELPGTNFVLQALDQKGDVLQAVPFALQPGQGEGEVTNLSADFNVSLTANPAIASLLLSYDGTLLATLTAGSTAPTVALTSPNGGQTFGSGPINIAWTASEAGGSELSYTIEYSADNGNTWQTLAMDWPEQSFVINGAQLPATTQGLISVIASDGFNTATAQSAAPFTVQPHAPIITITAPMSNSVVIGDQQLFLDATVEDMQDGILSGTNVQWFSDRDGALGAGAVVHFAAQSLSEGPHTITVIATDSAGLTNSATTRLLVLHYQPPTLSFDLTPGVPGFYAPYATLSWPSYYTNYIAQSSSNLAGVWTDVTNALTVLENQNTINVGVTNKNIFYRLAFQP